MENSDLTDHISKRFNKDIEDLKSAVLSMGGLVESQLQKAITAIVSGDSELGLKVANDDYMVNNMEVSIDEECGRILAMRAPAAGDLRLIVAIIKTITDLERIGDEAEKIAKCASYLTKEGFTSEYFSELEKLAGMVMENLSQALNALARLEADDALRIAINDDVIDESFEVLNKKLINSMSNNPTELDKFMRLSWSAKSLEKIGDHTTNICEYVIYLVKGKDVRHIDIETIQEEYF